MHKSIYIFYSFFFLFLLSNFKSSGQAAFTYSLNPSTGCAPVTVQFSDASTGASSWNWDLGLGGSPSTVQNPSIIYNDPGVYHVVLTINGGSSSVSQDITVNAPPAASFIASDTNICTGASITFTSTSVAGSGIIVKWIWGWGDGQVDSTSVPTATHTFGLANTYSVTLLVYNSNGCYGQSGLFNVTVVDGPLANFSFSPSTNCSAPAAINFTSTSTDVDASTIFLWDFGDTASGSNNTDATENASHTFNSLGSYTVTLTTSNSGCSTTQTYPVGVFQTIAGITSRDTVCYGSAAQFSNLSSTPTPSSQSWDFGDPLSGIRNSSSAPDTVHIFTAPGTYTVKLTTTANNCSDMVTKIIYVVPLPIISFVADDSTFCSVPQSVTFAPFTTSTITGWDWNFGDPGSGVLNNDSIQTPTHIYNAFGDYSVTLTVTDNLGCTSTITKPNYIQIHPPAASISPASPDSGCVPKTVTYTSTSSSPSDSITTYVWNFGDGTGDITGGAIQSHTYTAAGIYDVTITITTASGCTSTLTYPQLVRAGNKPTAAFSFSPDTVCFGSPVTALDSSYINPPDSITGWLWEFSDGYITTTQNATDPAVLDTGTFDILLYVYSNGCPDTLLKSQAFVVHPPDPEFTIVQNCDSPFVVQFIDISKGADSITWNFGDGTSYYGTYPADSIVYHTYTSIGTYTVTDSAWNFTYGCQWQRSHQVIVTNPIAMIVPDDTLKCFIATIQFNGTSSQDASTYLWDFGDPASSSNSSQQPIASHIYNDPGYYTVLLTIRDVHGCRNDTSMDIHVVGPTAGFFVDNITGCTPLTVNFTDTSHTEGGAIVSYFWNFNDTLPVNDTATVSTPSTSHVYSATGNYNVQLIVTDVNGCRDTSLRPSFIISTFPSPSFLSLDTFVCPDFLITNILHPGVQTPAYTVTWDFGDSTTPTVINNDSVVTHTYTSNNFVYPLTVTVADSNGCSKSITANITVLRPTASFTSSIPINLCGVTQIDLHAATGDSINYWNFNWIGPFNMPGESKDSLSEDQSFLFTIPGAYVGSLIVTNPGCTDTSAADTLAIVPGPSGIFNFINDSLCSPDTVTFFVHPDNADFINYYFGDGITLINTQDTVVTHIYYGTGLALYYPDVSLGFLLNGTDPCTVGATNLTDTVVNIVNVISVNVTQDTILMTEGLNDTLTSVAYPAGGNYTYMWDVINGDGTIGNIDNGSSAAYTSAENDSAIVLTLQDAQGCQAYDTVIVIIVPCEGELHIPNVFTPNDDAKNDTYYIDNLCPIVGFKFEIYNRWGNKVYESGDYSFHWDGKNMSGDDCSEGTYYYVMKGKKKNLHGYITLIRKK